MSGGGNRGLMKMLAVALAAFAFTFALVPLYRIACEKVFGVRLEKGPVAGVSESATAAERWVTVQFDGGVNSKLPWSFEPEQLTMRVQPGKQYEAMYFAKNLGDRAIVGNAVPSVAPARASGYFAKTECFCFTAQTLQPGEARDMPVRFIVDPNLPTNINTLTLSYTFFKNETQTAQANAPAASADLPRAAP
ncbi:cytochrome c oxidase assembly protein [Cognatiluteimonas lumbrici]|uniref:cytochrome c oxidase assembly protein n=1 Tax=Cognatiluteimonas lumbrici TaxID=2559601 RepID=UPI00112834DF|nr:cytochrome c oxidase assembly protein [Luteimonas lumbrici]